MIGTFHFLILALITMIPIIVKPLIIPICYHIINFLYEPLFFFRGLTSDAYCICVEFVNKHGSCRYGERCVDAHGPEELAEWRERFEYRRMRMERAHEKQLYGKSYTETILEK